MHVHFERVDYVLRIFADCDEFGSPRYWMAAVRQLAADTVRIVGVRRKITPKIREALYQAARERGWKYVEYREPQPDGTWKDFAIDVPREAAR